MSEQTAPRQIINEQMNDQTFIERLRARNRRGKVGQVFFFAANIIALLTLIALIVHVLNQSMGLVIVRNSIEPATLSDRPLQELSEAELVNILIEQQPGRLRVMIRDKFSQVPTDQFTTAPLHQVLAGINYPEAMADASINDLSLEQQAAVLSDNLNQGDIYDLVVEQVIQPKVITSWTLLDSILEREAIEAEAAEKYADDSLEFRSWISWDFISSSVSSSATTAGLRTALLGSFWIITITAITVLVVGVAAAVYLEEYATGGNAIEQLIEINIRNLAAIPSVIYGMLGLAVFVRALGDVTSGAALGVTDTNGRTVLSAGLTLALLILPLLIVNAQEAIRAVPSSIREASYGLGATKWQTTWRQVLPAALPGILTGVILSLSRAIGETAPLLVVGASTFIGIDPNGPFSKFTVVPIQIYQWTSRPELVFKNVAAAAIIILLVVMVLMNASAIILRNRMSRRY
ncbi:MAG: phosphate ABC transporter, permease protein PstA [Anaerolineaceae bacterium]|nr:phosphate ABC transporter, permease protein PstA [Anaerolineaceae bacterium]